MILPANVGVETSNVRTCACQHAVSDQQMCLEL